MKKTTIGISVLFVCMAVFSGNVMAATASDTKDAQKQDRSIDRIDARTGGNCIVSLQKIPSDTSMRDAMVLRKLRCANSPESRHSYRQELRHDRRNYRADKKEAIRPLSA